MALIRPLLIACCFLLSAAAQGQSFSQLVVFGDSLSDTGNLAIVDFPPPYFQNRISNGLLVVDRLALALGKNAYASEHLLGRLGGVNFSVAGGNIVGSDPEDLESQISAYLQRVNSTADATAVYLIFAGGNDIRGLRNTIDSQQAQAQINLIADTLESHIRRLYQAGARHFVVPNVADIGRIPQTLAREAGSPGVSARLSNYSQSANQALATRLQNLVQDLDNINLLSLDLYAEFNRVLNNPQQFGFSTASEGCFDPDSGDIEIECLLFGFDQRVFFDSLHPSGKTNELIAQAFVPALLAFQVQVFTPEKPPALGGVLLLLLED